MAELVYARDTMESQLLIGVRKVHGPYERKDGRSHVVITYNDGSKRTVSYPKFLVEFLIGRELDPYKETIDHVDDDFTNNAWENLRIVSKKKHGREDALRVKKIVFRCAWCKKLARRTASQLDHNARKGKAGPFCSNKCSSTYSREVQLGRLDPFPPQPYIGKEGRVYLKKRKQGGVLVSTLVASSITADDILSYLKSKYPVKHSGKRSIKKGYTPRRKRVCSLCRFCGEKVSKSHLKYCSHECYSESMRGVKKPTERKVKRPSKKKLKRLVWKYPTTRIAKHYGVSDNAVAKWCKTYGIEKPPRGYWAKNKAGKI